MPRCDACPLPPFPPADVSEASPSTLGTSPEHQQQHAAAVQFGLVRPDSGGNSGGSGSGGEGLLLSEGSGLRPSGFKRSLSMAELSAAELVRQEDVGLQSADSSDRPSLAALAAAAAETQAELQAAATQAAARPAAL